MYQASPEDKASVLCFPSLLEQEFFLLAHKGSGFAFLLNKYCANRYSAPRFLSHGSSLWWPHLYNSQFIQHSIQGAVTTCSWLTVWVWGASLTVTASLGTALRWDSYFLSLWWLINWLKVIPHCLVQKDFTFHFPGWLICSLSGWISFNFHYRLSRW